MFPGKFLIAVLMVKNIGNILQTSHITGGGGEGGGVAAPGDKRCLGKGSTIC